MGAHTVILAGETQREYARRILLNAHPGSVVVFKDATRTDDQNAKLWPMLGDVSKQVVWYGAHLSSDEWKDVFTAALRKAKVVPGLDGGFVVLGQRTSQMGKREFSDLIELIYAFGAEQGVVWSEQVRA